MSHKLSVQKIASLQPHFDVLKIGLCAIALVLSYPTYAVPTQDDMPQGGDTQAITSLGPKPNSDTQDITSLGPKPNSDTQDITSLGPKPNNDTQASSSLGHKPTNDIKSALNKDNIATDNSAAYVPSIADEGSEVKVSPASAQANSNVKERAKVYRDPYGNRLKAPPRTQSYEKRSEQEEKAAVQLEQQNLNRPTSSLSKVTSSAGAATASNNATDSPAATDQITTNNTQVQLKSAVVFFSLPEKSDTDKVDAMSGASSVKIGDNILGITEYEANLIAKYTNAPLYRIQRAEPYSNKHSEIIMQSSDEADSSVKPQIKLTPELDPSNYDVIFVGFPIWWSDMPMPLYSYFDKYDLSGKVVIPFCTYGQKSRNKLFTKLASLEANAKVPIKQGLKAQRSDIASNGDAIVKQWLEKLDSTSFKGLLPPNKDGKAEPNSADQAQGAPADDQEQNNKATMASTKVPPNPFAPGKASIM